MRATCIAIVPLLCAASSYGLTLQVVSQSVVPDFNGQQYNFSVLFNRAPDFLTVSSYGQQADSFQFVMNKSAVLPFRMQTGPDFVCIRGAEIHHQGDIPIRSVSVPDDDPPRISGGWGGVVGRVPYMLDGAALTFSVSLDQIDPDGNCSYALETYEYGAWGGQTIWSQTPEPASLALLAFGGLMMRRRPS